MMCLPRMRRMIWYFLNQKRSLFYMFCVYLSGSVVLSYNIDLEHPIVFRGPASSFFGYSVLEHYHDNTRWVLVGAPKANSTYSSSVHTPGAVFKCRVHSNPERRCTEMDLGRGNKPRESCGKTCQGDRDDEWMGVSLARQDKPNGKVLACAHRWKNVYYDSEHILPHGYCSIIPSTLQGRTKPLIPCYEGLLKCLTEDSIITQEPVTTAAESVTSPSHVYLSSTLTAQVTRYLAISIRILIDNLPVITQQHVSGNVWVKLIGLNVLQIDNWTLCVFPTRTNNSVREHVFDSTPLSGGDLNVTRIPLSWVLACGRDAISTTCL